MTLALLLSKASAQDVTVRVRTADGSALAGSDYGALDQVVTVPAGQTSVEVQVTLLGGQGAEPVEGFTLYLSDPDEAGLGQLWTTEVLIQDVSAGGGSVVFAIQGEQFSGEVARFAAPAGTYSARIYWGDGAYSDGTVSDGGDGTFGVSGQHAWARPGPYALAVAFAGGALPAFAASAALVFAPRDQELYQSVSAASVAGAASVSQGVDYTNGTFVIDVAASGGYHFERTAWQLDDHFGESEDASFDLWATVGGTWDVTAGLAVAQYDVGSAATFAVQRTTDRHTVDEQSTRAEAGAGYASWSREVDGDDYELSIRRRESVTFTGRGTDWAGFGVAQNESSQKDNYRTDEELGSFLDRSSAAESYGLDETGNFFSREYVALGFRDRVETGREAGLDEDEGYTDADGDVEYSSWQIDGDSVTGLYSFGLRTASDGTTRRTSIDDSVAVALEAREWGTSDATGSGDLQADTFSSSTQSGTTKTMTRTGVDPDGTVTLEDGTTDTEGGTSTLSVTAGGVYLLQRTLSAGSRRESYDFRPEEEAARTITNVQREQGTITRSGNVLTGLVDLAEDLTKAVACTQDDLRRYEQEANSNSNAAANRSPWAWVKSGFDGVAGTTRNVAGHVYRNVVVPVAAAPLRVIRKVIPQVLSVAGNVLGDTMTPQGIVRRVMGLLNNARELGIMSFFVGQAKTYHGTVLPGVPNDHVNMPPLPFATFGLYGDVVANYGWVALTLAVRVGLAGGKNDSLQALYGNVGLTVGVNAHFANAIAAGVAANLNAEVGFDYYRELDNATWGGVAGSLLDPARILASLPNGYDLEKILARAKDVLSGVAPGALADQSALPASASHDNALLASADQRVKTDDLPASMTGAFSGEKLAELKREQGRAPSQQLRTLGDLPTNETAGNPGQPFGHGADEKQKFDRKLSGFSFDSVQRQLTALGVFIQTEAGSHLTGGFADLLKGLPGKDEVQALLDKSPFPADPDKPMPKRDISEVKFHMTVSASVNVDSAILLVFGKASAAAEFSLHASKFTELVDHTPVGLPRTQTSTRLSLGGGLGLSGTLSGGAGTFAVTGRLRLPDATFSFQTDTDRVFATLDEAKQDAQAAPLELSGLEDLGNLVGIPKGRPTPVRETTTGTFGLDVGASWKAAVVIANKEASAAASVRVGGKISTTVERHLGTVTRTTAFTGEASAQLRGTLFDVIYGHIGASGQAGYSTTVFTNGTKRDETTSKGASGKVVYGYGTEYDVPLLTTANMKGGYHEETTWVGGGSFEEASRSTNSANPTLLEETTRKGTSTVLLEQETGHFHRGEEYDLLSRTVEEYDLTRKTRNQTLTETRTTRHVDFNEVTDKGHSVPGDYVYKEEGNASYHLVSGERVNQTERTTSTPDDDKGTETWKTDETGNEVKGTYDRTSEETDKHSVREAYGKGPPDEGGVSPLTGTLVAEDERKTWTRRAGNSVKGGYELTETVRDERLSSTRTEYNGPRTVFTTATSDTWSVANEEGSDLTGDYTRYEVGDSEGHSYETTTTALAGAYERIVTVASAGDFTDDTTKANHVRGDYRGTYASSSQTTRTSSETNRTRNGTSTETTTTGREETYQGNEISGDYREDVTSGTSTTEAESAETLRDGTAQDDRTETESSSTGWEVVQEEVVTGNSLFGTRDVFSHVLVGSYGETTRTTTLHWLDSSVVVQSSEESDGWRVEESTENEIAGSYEYESYSEGTGHSESTTTNRTLTSGSDNDADWQEWSGAKGNQILGGYEESRTRREGYDETFDHTNQYQAGNGFSWGWSTSTTEVEGNEFTGDYQETVEADGSEHRESVETTASEAEEGEEAAVLRVVTTSDEDWSQASTDTGNDFSGDYVYHGESASYGESEVVKTNQTLRVRAERTEEGHHVSDEEGNVYTGVYSVEGTTTSAGTRDEQIWNQTLYVFAHEESGSTVTVDEGSGGDSVTGTWQEYSTTDGWRTVSQTDTNGPLTVVSWHSSSSQETAEESGGEADGDYHSQTWGEFTSDDTRTATNGPLAVVTTAHEEGNTSSTADGNSLTGESVSLSHSYSTFVDSSTQTNQTLTVTVESWGWRDSTDEAEGNGVAGWSAVTTETDGEATTRQTIERDVEGVIVSASSLSEASSHGTSTRTSDPLGGGATTLVSHEEIETSVPNQDDDNQALQLTTTRGSETTTDTEGEGNSISGAYDRTTTTHSWDWSEQSGGNGVWTMTASHDSTTDADLRAWGNEITGESHSAGNSQSEAEQTQSRDYEDGSGFWAQVTTGSSEETSSSDGNGITGESHSTSTVVEAGSQSWAVSERGGVSYVEVALTAQEDVVSTWDGNEIEGDYVSTTSGAQGGGLTRTLTSAQGTRTWTTASASDFQSTEQGNSVSGDYARTQHEDFASSSSDQGALDTETTTTGDRTRWESGNSVTGAYEIEGDETEQTVTYEVEFADGSTIAQTDVQSVSVTGGGNRVTGDAELTRETTDEYTLEQELAGTAGFTLTVEGTLTGTQTEQVVGTTGEVTRTLDAEDEYQAWQDGTGTDEYALWVGGTETVSQTVVGNLSSGLFARTVIGAGEYERLDSEQGADADTYGYEFGEEGNGQTGEFDAVWSGLTRYELLRAFLDGSNALGANGEGNTDFSPFGGAFSAREGVGLALMDDWAGGQGDFLLHGGLADLVPGDAQSGAQTQSPYAELGATAFANACFVAGTHLLTPDGSKPIQDFKVGDLVLSRDEHDPHGEVVPKRVEEVFVRTGRVWVLTVEGREIGTTGEHPFFPVRLWKWAAARELVVGDLLLGKDGRLLRVEALRDTGEYARVYNMRIADFHTYFAGTEMWGWGLWAHNDYDGFKRQYEQTFGMAEGATDEMDGFAEGGEMHALYQQTHDTRILPTTVTEDLRDAFFSDMRLYGVSDEGKETLWRETAPNADLARQARILARYDGEHVTPDAIDELSRNRPWMDNRCCRPDDWEFQSREEGPYLGNDAPEGSSKVIEMWHERDHRIKVSYTRQPDNDIPELDVELFRK